MTRSTRGMIGRGTRARVDPAYDRFLQAPFDEDRKEQLLTVVSILARLDLDPWHEAAVLAGLSPAAAIERLTALFKKVPDSAAVPRDPARIASRLVHLLPRAARDPVPPSADQVPEDDQVEETDDIEQTPSRARTPWLKTATIVVLLIIMAIATYTGSPLNRLLGSRGDEPAGVTTTSPLGADPK